MISAIEARQVYYWLVAAYKMEDGKMLFDGKKAPDFIRSLEYSKGLVSASEIADLMDKVECVVADTHLYAMEFPENFVASLGVLETDTPSNQAIRLAMAVLQNSEREDLVSQARQVILYSHESHLRNARKNRLAGLCAIDTTIPLQ